MNAPDPKKSRFGFRKKIKELLNLFNLMGLILGGIGGLIYFLSANTLNGTFPITSNPFFTVAWGALIGFLVADIIYQSVKKRHK